MKKSTLAIIGILGIGVYLYVKNRNTKPLTMTDIDSAIKNIPNEVSNEISQVVNTTTPNIPTGSSNIADVPVNTPIAPAPAVSLPTSEAPAVVLSKYFNYTYGKAMSGCTIYWENKDGSKGSAFVASGEYFNVPCMKEGTGSGCGAWTKNYEC